MNLLDIIALAIICISALVSLRVGFLREMFALASLLLGLLGAVILGRIYGDRIPNVLGDRAATQVAFFIVSFLIVYLIVGLLGGVAARASRTLKLGALDHLLGFAFGIVRGALLCFLLIVLLALILPANSRLLSRSRAYAYAQGPMRVFASLLPDAAASALDDRPPVSHPGQSRETHRPRGLPI